MSIIQRFEWIISLFDAGESPSKIKGHLVAMREEMEAYSKAADEQSGREQAHLNREAELLGVISNLQAFKAKVDSEDSDLLSGFSPPSQQ
jgi:hypothetical protein